MTVIAASLKEVAADSFVSVTDARHYLTTKIFRLKDGSIIGACGTGYELVMEWLKAGAIPENAPIDQPEDADFQILRLTHDGLLMYVNSPYPDKMRERIAAIGSGWTVAMYCMKYLKMSPLEAARESSRVSPGCGGPIDVLKLKR